MKHFAETSWIFQKHPGGAKKAEGVIADHWLPMWVWEGALPRQLTFSRSENMHQSQVHAEPIKEFTVLHEVNQTYFFGGGKGDFVLFE